MASIETHNLNPGRNGLKVYSSYGDLLNEVVEDEFELTVEDPNLHKIIVKPIDLALRGRQGSLLFQAIYNQQIEDDHAGQQLGTQMKPIILTHLSRD